MNKIAGCVVSIFLFISIAGAAVISSPSDLLKLFEYTFGGFVEEDITLLTDLDFSETKLDFPLGYSWETKVCTVYKGILDGKKHTIKGLKVGSELNPLSMGGLFCGLDGATIKDLTIDSQSLFQGEDAGALSLKVTGGGASIQNVEIQAKVKGTKRVGGFIGYIENAQTRVSFDSCSFKGTLENGENVGGFIGYVKSIFLFKLDFWFCSFHGSYSLLTDNVGGLIGCVDSSSDISIGIRSTTTWGSMFGSDNLGGFIGSVQNNDKVSITIASSDNHGSVMSQFGTNHGGLIGSLKGNTVSKVDIQESYNKGNINGKSYVAGFIGYVDEAGSMSSLSVKNSINTGTIEGASSVSCGFFCTDVSAVIKMEINVHNSVNHGNVAAEYAYGVSNVVPVTSNVVNLGSVNGKLESYSLWKAPSVDQFCYALSSTCKNCGMAVHFFKEDDGTYYVSGTKMRVDDMLNWMVSLNQNWKQLKFWTKSLDYFIPKHQSVSLAPKHGLSALVVFFVLCASLLAH